MSADVASSDSQHDVVIAGAGPAGLQCARDTASRGYDVLVLETEEEDGFPGPSNKSTGGSFPRMLARFNVPDDVVMHFTDNVVVESPGEQYVRRQAGAVLEFAEFKRWLVAEARRAGAELRFDARVSAPLVEDGTCAGVTYNGDQTARAKVTIDATGPAAPLAKKLGVTTLDRAHQAVGIEHEFEGIQLDHPDYEDITDAMMLRLDHEIAPGGYAWVFHTGEDTAKVGICFLQNESYKQYAQAERTVDGFLDHWLDIDPRFENAERLEGKTHRGSAHIQPPGAMTTDNFIAIGDTVPTVDPLWGEGIDVGMRSGRAAAVTIDEALSHREQDTSASNVEMYNDEWHAHVAPNARTRLLMTELLYFASNDRYDQFIRDLSSFDEEALESANNGRVRNILRFIHGSDLGLLGRWAKHRFSDQSWETFASF
jgi:digeranylgeranylglycerophospholipid reductase